MKRGKGGAGRMSSEDWTLALVMRGDGKKDWELRQLFGISARSLEAGFLRVRCSLSTATKNGPAKGEGGRPRKTTAAQDTARVK